MQGGNQESPIKNRACQTNLIQLSNKASKEHREEAINVIYFSFIRVWNSTLNNVGINKVR